MARSSYFSFLGKNKYYIIIIVAATIIAAYFLVKKLPDQYISHAQIATGIVDRSRHSLNKDGATPEGINHQFNNLLEIINLNKIIDNVSYQLIIHDLSSSKPFRKSNNPLFKHLSNADVQHALLVYKYKLQNSEPLSLYGNDENILNQLLISKRYDERSLRKNLNISRKDESDFISVSFSSENPQLSAFVVNALCKEFINYYTENVDENDSNAIAFLSNILDQKRNALNEKKDELQKYKIKNGILNIDEQSKAIFAQILAYTDKKIQSQKDLASYEVAIKDVDAHFDPQDRKYIESTISRYNQTITNTEAQLKSLNDEYVRSGFNPSYKPALDSLRKQLTTQTNLSSDKYISNPLISKDNLVQKKLDLEISRDLAQYNEQSIDGQLDKLNAKFARLVPFDATVKTYESDIDIASKEYLDVLNKYTEANLQSNFSIKLTQVEIATPDAAQPSKKILLIVLSGITGLLLCLLVLFIIFSLDDKVREPFDLVNRTKLPLLGSLNVIPGPTPDLRKLWDVEHRNQMQKYKELARSIRFEIDQELKGEKVLAITSLGIGEGKTLLASSLAYSYATINKKVLLIDGNFNNPTISGTIRPKLYIEDYFKNNSYIERDGKAISVLGNHGGDITLLEINDEKPVKNAFDELITRFDIIIMDLPPLDSLNTAKEWILFANKTIAVFEANKNITFPQYQYIDYLKKLNTKFAGWVLNKAAVNYR